MANARLLMIAAFVVVARAASVQEADEHWEPPGNQIGPWSLVPTIGSRDRGFAEGRLQPYCGGVRLRRWSGGGGAMRRHLST